MFYHNCEFIVSVWNFKKQTNKNLANICSKVDAVKLRLTENVTCIHKQAVKLMKKKSYTELK